MGVCKSVPPVRQCKVCKIMQNCASQQLQRRVLHGLFWTPNFGLPIVPPAAMPEQCTGNVAASQTAVQGWQLTVRLCPSVGVIFGGEGAPSQSRVLGVLWPPHASCGRPGGGGGCKNKPCTLFTCRGRSAYCSPPPPQAPGCLHRQSVRGGGGGGAEWTCKGEPDWAPGTSNLLLGGIPSQIAFGVGWGGSNAVKWEGETTGLEPKLCFSVTLKNHTMFGVRVQ